MDIRKFFGGGIPKKKKKEEKTIETAQTTTTAAKSVAKTNNGSTNRGDSSSRTRSSPPARRESSPRKEKRTRNDDEEEVKYSSKTKIENNDDIKNDCHDTQATDNVDDDDTEEMDYLEQARKRRMAARDVGNGGDSASTSRIKSGGAGRRRRVINDEEDDDDADDEVMVDDDNDDDDDDFQPNANNDDDDDDDDDDADEQPLTKKTSPTKKRQLSPSPSKRTSPRKMPASSSIIKKQSADRPTSSFSTPKTLSTPTPSHPPKYHPPSSKLTTYIPFLCTATSNEDGINKNNNSNTQNKITLPHATSHHLPKLPQTDNFLSTFTDDTTITPHCLDGLTFVFTGILSTNDAYTSQTNAQVALSSPSKGDYYTNRRYDCSTSSYELSRDAAVDIIKCLGGRVTTMVSGKTDYVICGNILEDGRVVTEGSKYKKCVELWEAWSAKWRKEYQSSGNIDDDNDNADATSKSAASSTKKKKKTAKEAKPKRDHDPNTLVEVIHGINEFYGLVMYLSEWKKSTLSETERMELNSRQLQKIESASATASSLSVATGDSVKKEEETNNDGKPSASLSTAAAVSNPYQSSVVPSNPYTKKSIVANPYVKASTAAVANPYTKSTSTTSAAVSNPYTKKSVSTNSYANSTTTTTTSFITTASSSTRTLQNQQPSLHPGSGKELGTNSLWADKYAPSNTSEILGNSDSVNKLSRWLSCWEKTFNNPKKQQKGGNSGPNGPWKAALLSGPPGIGKTTTATLVARASGRDVLELNASDARSKKALGEALGDVTGSQVLCFDNMGKGKKESDAPPAVRKKRCIIMDEVDGMGAGDRSGMSELIQMIKKSKVPIICICNDRSSPKMKSLVPYCMDLKYSRPTKMVIAKRVVEIGRREGMNVEINAAEAMAESCGNDIRQVLNSLQMWSSNCSTNSNNNDLTYRELKERQYEINKDEVLRVSMFDACRTIVEGSRGLAGADAKAVTSSLMKRTDAYFVDYMMMGLMVHQNYLKVCMGQYNSVKLKGDVDLELESLNQMYDAAEAMSDFGMVEDNLRGGDQNWSLLPLCSLLAVKVGHHAGGPTGGFLPGFPEFAGWLGKNSTRNKKIRLLQEFCRHMNYKISADAPELRMNYLPIMRQQFEELLFHKDGPKVSEAIELMDEYGLDRDDVFENFDEFVFNTKELKGKQFGDLDSKAKAAFTRAYNAMAHKAQALVSEQGAEKTGRKKPAGGGDGGETGGAELDVVDDDKANEEKSDDDDDDAEDLETLKKKFSKKGGGNAKTAGKGKAPSKANGKKGKK